MLHSSPTSSRWACITRTEHRGPDGRFAGKPSVAFLLHYAGAVASPGAQKVTVGHADQQYCIYNHQSSSSSAVDLRYLPIHASTSSHNVSAISSRGSTTRPTPPLHNPHVRFSYTFILGETASAWSIPPCIRSWMAFSNPSIRVDMSFTAQANMSAERHERSVG